MVCAGIGRGGVGRASVRPCSFSGLMPSPSASRNSAASSSVVVRGGLRAIRVAVQDQGRRLEGEYTRSGGIRGSCERTPAISRTFGVSALQPPSFVPLFGTIARLSPRFPMRVLISNDDGVDAPGIRILAQRLAEVG